MFTLTNIQCVEQIFISFTFVYHMLNWVLCFQTVLVSISQQTVFVTGLDPNTENVPVKVLDCDTISQVKEKALDTIYRNVQYSQRPRKDDLDVGECIIQSLTIILTFLLVGNKLDCWYVHLFRENVYWTFPM